jgi:periplasmic divalent cation tolerance protein
MLLNTRFKFIGQTYIEAEKGEVQRTEIILPEAQSVIINCAIMKSATKFSIVLVTAPDLKITRRLAKAALRARLVACVNLVPRVESHYWWRGKMESGSEVLLVFKTTKRHLPALEKLILAKHPYETPEFLAVSLAAGNARYLKWIADSTVKTLGK